MATQYFLMSMQHDQEKPEDFGLASTDLPDLYKLSKDGSRWVSRKLFDFGWGEENGFCRIPVPGFDDLIQIALESDDWQNKYGAAAILLKDYPEQLLAKCETLLRSSDTAKPYAGFFKDLQLNKPINRSEILGKSLTQVMADYAHWKKLAERINELIG